MTDEMRKYLDSMTDYLNAAGAPLRVKRKFSEIRKHMEATLEIKRKIEENEKKDEYSKLLKDLYGE